ncbi:MAG: MBL fold metallo-hydrolase [Deltaproteobacteria bacterium HGW-Deltaproteobacteria-8]|nr:MAG: MBL fold metallo-hydrolase [Deltaproteobacteria bacterium HGW-Deltaproteobacteria-8]
MHIESFNLGPLETNCHVLSHLGQAVVVDPGGEPSEVLEHLRAQKLTCTHILVTHLHFDHIYGCAALARATGAPVLTPAGDAALMRSELGAGGMFGFPRVEPFESSPAPEGPATFAGLECLCLATPGHSPGSVSYYFPQANAAFVGDLIFYRSVGRTDFPGGSSATLKRSVEEKIFTLPGETVLYSGHGLETSVDSERTHNPFFLHEML